MADPTIRNQRYNPWPAGAINIALLVPLAAAALLQFHDVPLVWEIAAWSVALLASGVSGWFLLCLPVMHPVQVLKLGGDLTVLPKGCRLPPKGIERIEFAPDPAEDYVEITGPVRMCEVTV